MDSHTTQIKVVTKDPKLKPMVEEMARSVEGFSVQSPHDTNRSDLMIFELGDNTERDFAVIHSLEDLNKVGEFFLVSRQLDQAVLLKAIRAGVKEFFPLPVEEEKLKQALIRFRDKRRKSNNTKPVKIGRIVDVIGSKGGIGTTTVAVNMAVSLSEMTGSPSVALIDGNPFFGELPLFLEMTPQHHLGEITKNISRLDTTFLTNILSKHSSGVYVLPSQASLNGYPSMTPEIMEHLLGLMQRMFDFVVIDGGRSVDMTSLKILEISDVVFLVSILSLPCLSNTSRLLETFQSLGYPAKERTKVIINRYLKNTDISLEDAEGSIAKKIFWTIPNDYRKTLSAINQGKPLSLLASKAAITKSLRGLADSLLPQQKKEEKRVWKFLRKG